MAITDERNYFADAMSVAMAAGTANLTNQIDLGAADQDVGVGDPLYAVVVATTGIITGGVAGTIQFRLVSDAQAAIDLATCSVHETGPSFATGATEIAAGTVLFCVALPPHGGGAAYEEFLGMQVIVGTTATTAGAVDAFLTTVPPGNWKSLADAAK